METKGKVYIIGAGPGDPGLLTLKGFKALKEAEVIIYDHLVSPGIIALKAEQNRTSDSPDEGPGQMKPTRLIYAGKEGGDHTLSQDEINERLVAEAAQGRIVARLKGGDPFVFGRGGEEAEVLARAGIPFEIIPGVTSAVAVPAYAGIPLTHRGFTSAVALVTGHEDPGKEKSDLDWPALARIGTLVFLMGVKNLSRIVSSLLEAGKPPETPAALIRWGTTPYQETLTSTLGEIIEQTCRRGFRPPAIFVVGQIVGLRDQLNWFETRPLFGKTIVITRPKAQAGELSSLLEEAGARVIRFPVIEIVPPETYDDLDSALGRIESYHWIIFTSVNGVRPFFKRLREQRDIRDLKGIRICAIGPITARAVAELGLRVDVVPASYLSEGIVEALGRFEVAGKRFLLPRAEESRELIPEELTRRGAVVDTVTAYRTVRVDSGREKIAPLIEAGEVDMVTFTSPSTVRGFMEIWGTDPWPDKTRVACLGPVTAAAAERFGLPVDVLEEVFTVEGLVRGIISYVKSAGGENS